MADEGDLHGENIFRASPLTRILKLHTDLLKQVTRLETRLTRGEALDALAAAMTLLCQDLGEFMSYRFARLHDVIQGPRPRTWFRRRQSVLVDKTTQVDLEVCHRIGRALTEALSPRLRTKWDVETELVTVYKCLAMQLAKRRGKPLSPADFPRVLKKFKRRACELARKYNEGQWTDAETRAARSIAGKAIAFTVTLGALVGLEQDIVPFSKDVASVGLALVQMIDGIVDDDGGLNLPPPPHPAGESPPSPITVLPPALSSRTPQKPTVLPSHAAPSDPPELPVAGEAEHLLSELLTPSDQSPPGTLPTNRIAPGLDELPVKHNKPVDLPKLDHPKLSEPSNVNEPKGPESGGSIDW
jgi:hypothetical protein